MKGGKSGKLPPPPPPPPKTKGPAPPKLAPMPAALDPNKVYEPIAQPEPRVIEAPPKPVEQVDGYEPEREKLRNNPDFAKYIKLLKMKVPMKNILLKVKGEGVFTED